MLPPLPAGMSDALPAEAAALRDLGARVMASFELSGFQQVQVPTFEYEEVLERGLGALDPGEVLRFVEPETGEVVALRPDMTPQLARLLSARLAEVPGPARLSYQGSVVRRRLERGRRRRQIQQAGVELLGAAAPDGDLEVLSVACAAVVASGLTHFTLDLGHAGIAAALLEGLPRASWGGLVEAMELKDTGELERRAALAGAQGGLLRALTALPSLQGEGQELWSRAESLLGATAAAQPVRELRSLWELVSAADMAPRVMVDLGEVRHFAYYTGAMFQLLAEGPGEPVGSGGRYDGLLARFGAPRPSAGCGLDLSNLLWARRAAGIQEAAVLRVLVAAPAQESRALLEALHARGIVAAQAPEQSVVEHARAWCYSHVLWRQGARWRLQAIPAHSGDVVGEEPTFDGVGETLARAVSAALGRPER